MSGLRIVFALTILLQGPIAGYRSADVSPARRMLWGDFTRLGRPFSKDPSVIHFRDRYLLYYSMPAYGDGRPRDGWAIGIAESRNLIDWRRIGEFTAKAKYEAKGIAAPFAKVIEGQVHLIYQTYGNGPKDALCHAVSRDGLTFERDASNPIFHATGKWNSGRAIDGEIVRDGRRWLLFAVTRDPKSKLQMVTGAFSEGGLGRGSWRPLADGPLLKPELPWEKDCVEAPALLKRGEWLYMFYAGAYNNSPQQIGVARSRDAIHWERIGSQPFLPNGRPDEWNASESGHPGIFVDDDGETYLFYQGNNDKGRTWLLSFVRVGWRDDWPFVLGDSVPAQ